MYFSFVFYSKILILFSFCFVSSSCSCDGKSGFFLHSLRAWPESDTSEVHLRVFWYLVCDLWSRDYWLTDCSSQANTGTCQDLAVPRQWQDLKKLFSRHWAVYFPGHLVFKLVHYLFQSFFGGGQVINLHNLVMACGDRWQIKGNASMCFYTESIKWKMWMNWHHWENMGSYRASIWCHCRCFLPRYLQTSFWCEG